jgi:hypothetical protein
MKPSNSIHQWRAPKQRHVTPRKVITLPTERRCTVCEQIKPITDFHWNNRNQRPIARCKPCMSEIRRRERQRKNQGKPRRNNARQRLAKLTPEDVRQIKQLLIDHDYHYEQWQRLTYRALAEKFEVSTGCIAAIADGKNWKDVL